MRVRFAPSPTGHLHVGNARTALFNWLLARHAGGTFILRIEDTDTGRSTRESEEAIFEDLRWLGLSWDEGPYRQSDRRDHYRLAADRLLAQGDAYRCFCPRDLLERDREAQRAAGQPPRYAGRCRAIPAEESARRAASGEPHALRFHARAGDGVAFDDLVRGSVFTPSGQIGDFVIVRADGGPTYNFAVVVDDAAMKITHVVRGEDHISNTPRQVLLYRALQERPPAFAHLALVLGPDGAPLSKRHGDSSVADFRERGILPEAMANYLALLGWSHPEGKEALAIDEIVPVFSLSRAGRAAAMFDARKLAWLNAHHLRARSPERLLEACREDLQTAGFLPPSADSTPAVESWAGRALAACAGQMSTIRDAAPATEALFRFEGSIASTPAAAKAIASLAGEPGAHAVVAAFAAAAGNRGLLLDRESFRAAASEAGRAAGVKGKALYHPIRVALTASQDGPELDRLVPLIDEGSALPLPEPILSSAKRARLVADRLERGA